MQIYALQCNFPMCHKAKKIQSEELRRHSQGFPIRAGPLAAQCDI